ncbi:MAG: ribonuclease P protein component 4 [Thermoplasmata archaeon]
MKKDSRRYDLAIDAIDSLFTMANETRNSNESRSRRYVYIAEKIAARMDITLEREIKRSYCKGCKIIYGADTQIRLSNRVLTIKCGHCGSVKRIPY